MAENRTTKDPTDYNVRAVERALQIMECFDDEHPERGISDIAQAVGLHKATAHRIVTTLVNYGYLERVEDGQKYRLGLELPNLGYKVLSMKRAAKVVLSLLVVLPLLAAGAGTLLAGGMLHPMKRELTSGLVALADEALARVRAEREDFEVRAPDGMVLRGWKVHPPNPGAEWVLLFHGVSDNRVGVTGHAEFLLRNGYNVLMMDARARSERRRQGHVRLARAARRAGYRRRALRKRTHTLLLPAR